ncbi:hypothetical protein AMATHDRAFT_71618 [Amanita thiersii Skay4041]|uniref:Uncharacterized protein n=1 Tax=Amanita thiersii Skay4041 TaxID=703135 RepID=A0A2A9NBB1_9AGAR|nr:hypothetical protein AMATHDRAFT_71618 [Amanita thiersii Skay4041]
MTQTTLPTTKSAPPVQVPAIQSLYPYVVATLSVIAGAGMALYRLLMQLGSKALQAIILFSPLPLLFYLLSPIFVLCNILLELLVLTPMRIVQYFANALYPLYVFCGVACIIGCFLGWLANFISNALVKSMRRQPVSSPPTTITTTTMTTGPEIKKEETRLRPLRLGMKARKEGELVGGGKSNVLL